MPNPPNKIDIVGKKFNDLTCIKQLPRKKNQHNTYYLFKCECGNECEIAGNYVRNGIIKRCKDCKWQTVKEKFGAVGEISKQWWYSHLVRDSHVDKKRRRKRSKLKEVKIDIQYAWDLFLKQDRKCKFSGIVLTFPKTQKDRASATASIDRIDSKKGYVKGNIQWVHKYVNRMKLDKTDDEFIEMCRMIVAYQDEKLKLLPVLSDKN